MSAPDGRPPAAPTANPPILVDGVPSLAEFEALRALARALLSAQEEERGRVAHDLHERVAQSLTALRLGLDVSPIDAAGRERLRTLAADVLRDVRRLALDLRPTSLDTLGLEAALRACARELRALGGPEVDVYVALHARASPAPAGGGRSKRPPDRAAACTPAFRYADRVPPIRLFLVDDHAIVRAGVRALLEAHEQLQVVGEAESGEDALVRVPGAAPDVVLLDLTLPGMNGIATARALRAEVPSLRLVALSMHEDPESVQGFLEAGGSGYVPKSSLEAQLVDAILAVSRGEYYAPARLLAELAREMAQGDPYKHVKLTPREREVVRRIAQGSTYREIAEALGISEKTVATYRERASEKLGVRSRAELVRWALENGVLA